MCIKNILCINLIQRIINIQFNSFLLFIFFASYTSIISAEERTALVIGNGNYRYVPKLKNPVNDAADIARALKKLKFDVDLVTDASKKNIENAVKVFISKISLSDGIGMFYYAGHASQIEGNNFIIPVNVNIRSEKELKYKGYNISKLLGYMNNAKNEQNIVVLDACRDNPFASKFKTATRSLINKERGIVKIKTPKLNPGLSKLEAGPNTLIAYATAPGKVALDGDGRNSPYTKALIQSMQSEGLTVEQVFKQVRTRLLEQTNGKQIPWESSSLVSDFYFKKRKTLPSGW